MEERIFRFIAALRAAGVRISLAESADAMQAVNLMGVKDRELFRISLRSTLVKEGTDIAVFEQLFPYFFNTAESPPLMDLTQDLTQEESQMLAEALREFSQKLREALERLLKGEQLSQEELERLGRLVGLNQIDDMRYQKWMEQRITRLLGHKELRQAIAELAQMLEQLGMNKERLDQLRQMLLANKNALESQIQQHVGQKIAENMSERKVEDEMGNLYNRPFQALSEAEMEHLRKEVQRLATALRSRISLRQKKAKNGQLDAKATIRANLKHGNVPIELRYRQRHLKPKLLVICDVSTSMRFCSELMLCFIFALHDQIKKTHAFAFIDHIEYITPDVSRGQPNEGVTRVLERMPSGYYNTDLGNALVDLQRDYLDCVDNRTTMIVVGDGRNNYNDPRADLFKNLARRSRRTIWMNPEPTMLWGSGDSDMLQYAPACDTIMQVGNMAQLTGAIDKLLTR